MTNAISKLFDFFRAGLCEIGVLSLYALLSLFRFSDKSRYMLFLLLFDSGKVPRENASTFLFVAFQACDFTPELIADLERRLKYMPERGNLDAEPKSEEPKPNNQRPDRKLGHGLLTKLDGETLH